MEITVLIRIKHLSRKRPFLVKVPFSRFSFTFSPNPGRWLLCVAEFPGIPSCYLYEIVKVQVRAFSFWRINPSPIKLGIGCLPTPFCKFFSHKWNIPSLIASFRGHLDGTFAEKIIFPLITRGNLKNVRWFWKKIKKEAPTIMISARKMIIQMLLSFSHTSLCLLYTSDAADE